MSTFTPTCKVYKIDKFGRVTALYSDDLPALGKAETGRASNVEPGPKGGWDVVLSDHPLNGQHAGKVLARGVAKRADALAIEVKWINENIIGPKRKACHD